MLCLLVVRVVFEEENYGVTEGSDPVSVCVRREGHAAESFSINITTSDTLPVQAEGNNMSVSAETQLAVCYSGTSDKGHFEK